MKDQAMMALCALVSGFALFFILVFFTHIDGGGGKSG
jgi:hypothetical protein